MAQNETLETATAMSAQTQHTIRLLANQILSSSEMPLNQRVMLCSVSSGAGKTTLSGALAHQLQSASGDRWKASSFEQWLAQDETPNHMLIDGFAWEDQSSFLMLDHQTLQRVDAIVLVCVERQCSRQSLEAMLQWCASVNMPVLGVVLNHTKTLPVRQRVKRLFRRLKRPRALPSKRPQDAV